jgi:hypothetical protein
VILEIGSRALHFNSRDECGGKFGGFKLRDEKTGRRSKSMEHNVDNLCKHNILRFTFFPLDLRL